MCFVQLFLPIVSHCIFLIQSVNILELPMLAGEEQFLELVNEWLIPLNRSVYKKKIYSSVSVHVLVKRIMKLTIQSLQIFRSDYYRELSNGYQTKNTCLI